MSWVLEHHVCYLGKEAFVKTSLVFLDMGVLFSSDVLLCCYSFAQFPTEPRCQKISQAYIIRILKVKQRTWGNYFQLAPGYSTISSTMWKLKDQKTSIFKFNASLLPPHLPQTHTLTPYQLCNPHCFLTTVSASSTLPLCWPVLLSSSNRPLGALTDGILLFWRNVSS